MRHRRPSVGICSVVLACLTLALGACSSGSDDAAPERASSTAALAFKPCGEVECTGEINGAKYQIVLPKTWNGTLLLYSHGYRFAQPVPPDFAEPSTDAVPAPAKDLADDLLAKGFALAGSSFSSNGWAVPEGVQAAQELHDYFAKTVGTPRRVYLWGDSLGGLVTQTLAEKGLPWVSGAAPLCGVVGGTNENLDLALDVAYAVRELVAPKLRLTGFSSHQAAVKQWQYAQRSLVAAATTKDGPARIALIAALVDAPTQTATFDGSDPVSRISAAVESALSGLGYGTYGRYDIEQRLGGNPSQNAGVDYAPRVSDLERQFIEVLGGPGATDRLLSLLAAGPRVTADAGARSKAAATLGEPKGGLRVPTVTLHTTKDPLVLVQNERLFGDRVRAAGRQGELVQVYVVPPATFTAPAPYGAGHCNFTAAQRGAAIDLLDSWVRTGTRPSGSAVHAATTRVPGLNGAFVPSPWPAQTQQ